jgi:hypothetical protein
MSCFDVQKRLNGGSGNVEPRSRFKGRAPVAQLDRAPDYESGGQGFESLRARQCFQLVSGNTGPACFPEFAIGKRMGNIRRFFARRNVRDAAGTLTSESYRLAIRHASSALGLNSPLRRLTGPASTPSLPSLWGTRRLDVRRTARRTSPGSFRERRQRGQPTRKPCALKPPCGAPGRAFHVADALRHLFSSNSGLK